MSHDVEGSPRADVLLLQPMPTNVQLIAFTVGGRPVTAISRSWSVEDARRCRLCAAGCTASVGRAGVTALCLKVHCGVVAPAEAALFRDDSPAGGGERSRGGLA